MKYYIVEMPDSFVPGACKSTCDECWGNLIHTGDDCPIFHAKMAKLFNPVVDTVNVVVNMPGINNRHEITGQVKISGEPTTLYIVKENK